MISQAEMQQMLQAIEHKSDMNAALNELYRWSFESGYLTEAKLNDNQHFEYPDPETGVTFKTQINIARSNYTPAPLEGRDIPKLHCPICFDNVGIPGKENLRAFEFELSGKPFFAQLTPFPLFPKHFVLIDKNKTPMIMDKRSVVDMVNFEAMASEFTVLSNSDVAWAGASVLHHHHYQAMFDLHLPIMEAKMIPEFSGVKHIKDSDVEYGLLNFPICTILVKSQHKDAFIEAAGNLIDAWRSNRADNTCNLCFHRIDGQYRLYILLRHPDYRTPAELTPIKCEGVGIVEVCGEGIYPIPKTDELMHEVEHNGLAVIKGIITGNNPVKRDQFKSIFDLL